MSFIVKISCSYFFVIKLANFVNTCEVLIHKNQKYINIVRIPESDSSNKALSR